MPGNYKKRRIVHGPNKNEQKIIRAKNAERQERIAGVLGAKFPMVKSLKMQLTFLDARKRVLEEKTLSLSPLDAAVFTAACPGRCGQGSFDFGLKLAEVVGAQLALSESTTPCAEFVYAASTEPCGCEVLCRMEINYFPVTKPAPEGGQS